MGKSTILRPFRVLFNFHAYEPMPHVSFYPFPDFRMGFETRQNNVFKVQPKVIVAP